MKNVIMVLLLILSALNLSQAQEWMTSLEIAKRLALIQNKMIFAVWENATFEAYPVLVNDNKGNQIIVDLFDNENLNEIIWEYFVPVILSESNYLDIYNEIKDKRKESYRLKFNDDSIKIMDPNGNILNTDTSDDNNELLNLSSFIAKYSLDTSFLQQDLISYSTEDNFTTAFYLASKYIDFAILNDIQIRSEIIELSNIYLSEARHHLESSDIDNKLISTQAIELASIKQQLVLNKPKKVLRQLKKYKNSEIYRVNEALFNFLHYTAFELLKDEKNAVLWKNKVSLVDLKKSKLIIDNKL